MNIRKQIERLRHKIVVDGITLAHPDEKHLEAADTLEKLQAEHKESELLWWDEKGQLEDSISELQAENDTFRGLIGQMMLRCSDNGVAIDDLFVVANGEIYPVAAMEDKDD